MAICKFEMRSLLMLMFCFIVVHSVQQNVNINCYQLSSINFIILQTLRPYLVEKVWKWILK